MTSETRGFVAASSATEWSRRRLGTTRSAVTGVLAVLLGITACQDGVTSPAAVVRNVATVSITPGQPPSLALGRSVTLQAVLRDSLGAAVSNAPLGWTSSDPTVVSIHVGPRYTSGAVAVALRVGTATITAISGSKTAAVPIVVHEPGPVKTVFLVGAGTVPLGKTSQLAFVLKDSDGDRKSVV